MASPTLQPKLLSSPQPQTPSRLLSIPLEVLLSITSNLPTPDYCSLRSTCKHVEAQLHNAFSREFFTKRQFMISEFSLQSFIDISKSRYSTCLTHVIIGTERIPTPNLHRWATPDSDAPNRRVHGYTDYLSLIHSGHDVEMLVEAFSNLPNLENVGLRDFYSRTRHRDYPRNEWRSYGARTWTTETESPLEQVSNFAHYSGAYTSQMFLALLLSLGRSGRRPKGFESILRNLSLPDNAFNLPTYLQPIIVPVLDSIRTLFLDLSSLPVPLSSTSSPTTRCSSYYLPKFLVYTPNLEHLRLNFTSYQKELNPQDFLGWLGCPVGFAPASFAKFKIPTSVQLPRLRQLDVGMIELESIVLHNLVLKFRTSLQILSLHKVCIAPPKVDNARSQTNLWAEFFNDISSLNVNLTTINMTSLIQAWGHSGQRRSVTFKDSKVPYVRHWSGTNTQSALRDFASQVEIRWMPNDSASESAHSSGEGESDEHSEDEDGITDEDDVSQNEEDEDNE